MGASTHNYEFRHRSEIRANVTPSSSSLGAAYCSSSTVRIIAVLGTMEGVHREDAGLRPEALKLW